MASIFMVHTSGNGRVNQLRKTSVLLFIFISLIYLLTASGHIGGDGLWVYCAAESAVLDGDLDISNMKESIDVPELRGSYNEIKRIIADLVQKGYRNIYTQYGIGQILLQIPFYLVGHLLSYIIPLFPHDYFTIFFVSMLNIFVVALCGVFLFRLCCIMFHSVAGAFLLTLIFCFGTFVYAYAVKSGLSDPVIMLCLTAGVYYAFLYRVNRDLKNLYLSGAWLSFGFLVKFYFIMLLPPVALYVLAIILPAGRPLAFAWRRFFCFLVPMISAMIIMFLYNYIRFENILETGYTAYGSAAYGMDRSIFDFDLLAIFGRGFGLLLSPGKGIFIFAPVLFAAAGGFIKFMRIRVLESMLILILVIEIFIFFACNILWHGEWSWGPRYLLTILPLAVLPAGAFLSSLPRKRMTQYGIIFLFTGVVIQVPAIVMNHSNTIRLSVDHEFYSYNLFLPQYSSIPMDYLLLFSGISKIITGKSLEFSLYYEFKNEIRYFRMDGLYTNKMEISLDSYDKFDLWFAFLLSRFKDRIFVQIAVLLCLSIMLFVSIKAYRELNRGLASLESVISPEVGIVSG